MTLPDGWTLSDPLVWLHRDGWIVTVDDDGTTLVGHIEDPDTVRPREVRVSPREAMQAISATGADAVRMMGARPAEMAA